MKKNDLLRYEDKVIRVLYIQENMVLIIDSVKCTMPVWVKPADLCTYVSYAALNVGNLSARFTQDVEDMNIEPDNVGGKNPEELKQGEKPKTDRPVTQKQLKYLETLMSQHNTSAEAMNKYCKTNFGVDDYKKITGVQASTLIEKFKAVE